MTKQKNHNIPKYIYVINKIKEDIKKGHIQNQLPGERALAKEMGISYMTIRKAIEILVDEGILYRKPTRGTFVNVNGMKGEKTMRIGFFLEEKIAGGISSPYYSVIFKGIEQEVKKRGYNLIFFTDIDDLNPLRNGKIFDGVIISCFPRIAKKIKEEMKFLPIVLIDNELEGTNIPFVGMTNNQGIIDAVDYLCGLGHRRVGFISGLLDSDIGWDRLKGYKTSVQNNNLDDNPALVFEGDYSFDAGYAGIKKLMSLKKKPTAVVCGNDTMAIGALKYLRENDLDVPDDLSIIGFDDIEIAEQFHPPLTTVAAPLDELIKESIGMLFSLINGIELKQNRIILNTKLIIRDSCKEGVN